MDVTDLVLTRLLPSILSGASAGLSAVLTWIKGLTSKVEDLSARVHKIEVVIGSIETRSGIAKTLQELEDSVRALKHENRLSTEHQTGKWRVLPENSEDRSSDWRKIRDLEDRVLRIENRLRGYVSEEDFDKHDRKRAEEIQSLRTSLAEIKGLLQGLQSALGLIKPNR